MRVCIVFVNECGFACVDVSQRAITVLQHW